MTTYPPTGKGLSLNSQEIAVATAERSISTFIATGASAGSHRMVFCFNQSNSIDVPGRPECTEACSGSVEPDALFALLVERSKGSTKFLDLTGFLIHLVKPIHQLGVIGAKLLRQIVGLLAEAFQRLCILLFV